MSSFTTPLVLKMLPNRMFEIHEEFSFYIGTKEDNKVITVPKGFLTDLTSVPRIFWSIIPPHGIYGKAAVLHDFMYMNAIESKDFADDVFLEAMKVLGVSKCKRTLMYYAVKVFGNGTY